MGSAVGAARGLRRTWFAEPGSPDLEGAGPPHKTQCRTLSPGAKPARTLCKTTEAEHSASARGIVGDESRMTPPPITETEQKSNLTTLQQQLHRQMQCFAGKNQVYLQSILGDDGGKTRPRIALKCSLRTDYNMDRHVYYEYIDDVCCGDPTQCPAYQMFLEKNPHSAQALRRTGSNGTRTPGPAPVRGPTAPRFDDSSLFKPVL